ncbi:leucine-rich repeat extensin-like protein 6 [Nasonia vitripennis]|uniref:Uncharacterized protein n=1 Tax=Nasonia vitripennis TaxID=7425 RepID=A0A7M7HDG4_NASVI|nr:leucine-rich repeat extensin-like protein 6 [Nasonia vitripennis]
MRLHACVAALLLLVQLGASQVGAVCVKVESQSTDPKFVCEGGSIADLDAVPNTVEELQISNMPIGRITESTFARFGRNLLVLVCTNCSISDIDDRAFRRLSNLQHLRLDNNRIKDVRAVWFEGLGDLSYLDLNNNGIERIDSEVFRNAPNLADLRFSGNRLECLDIESISRLQGLMRLYVNENPNFGCPNALKRFLIERHLESPSDPEWSSVVQDRVQAIGFGANTPPVPPQYYPSSTPPAYTRPRWTEVPPTSPPTEPPTTLPPTQPPRRPYVPETIQPSSPDSSFSMQPPYYPPQVTQQQINNYQSTMVQQNVSTTVSSTVANMTTNTTTAKVLLAGQPGPVTTTTECPNAASSIFGDSTLLLLMTMFVARKLALL